VNVKEYISSGIIESYVLGLADDAERTEFEMMYAAHEEVRAAKLAFEDTLEVAMLAGSVAPPVDVKAKLFSRIDISAGSRLPGSVPPFTLKHLKDETDTQTGQQPGLRSVNSRPWIKYLAAASVLLLVASSILNFYLFRQYREFSDRYSSLLASQTALAADNKALQTSVNRYRNNLELIKNPNMAVIQMAANQVPGKKSPDPTGMATVFWNRQTTEVFLMVNQLPAPAPGKQYQLWAIVGGKPVSAGVFDMSSDAMVQLMTKVPAAQAFALTLEKEGGSDVPQGVMYVLGST
jgi:anti-sigma-K factor RskA